MIYISIKVDRVSAEKRTKWFNIANDPGDTNFKEDDFPVELMRLQERGLKLKRDGMCYAL